VIRIRFYAELNDFLRGPQRAVTFEHVFEGQPAVRDVIESLGVPHTEVDVILVNGMSVGFDAHVHDGDRVSVYPVFESLDVTPIQHLRPAPLRATRFVLDGHLGKLARALRLLGFDAAHRRDVSGRELVAQAIAGGRTILTRDRELLKARVVTHGVWIRSTDPWEQLVQVLDRFDLRGSARPFTRCTRCNGELLAVSPDDVRERVPPRVRERMREYFCCADCRQVYWKGTHVARLEAFVREALAPREA
jgi:hypothetical protein